MCDSARLAFRIGDQALAAGAHLVTQRRGYTHHGIYAGDGRVVHYSGLSRTFRRGPILESSIEDFAGGQALWIEQSSDARYIGEEAVRRAYLRLGEDRYRLATNNCEHFCSWCLYGESRSEQIDRLVALPGLWLRKASKATGQLMRVLESSMKVPAYVRTRAIAQ
jgi:hypothetical protein